MAKKTGRKSTGRKKTPSKRRQGAGARAAARSGAGARRAKTAGRNTGRKAAGAKTPRGKAARKKPSSAKARTGGRTAATKQARAAKRAPAARKRPAAPKRKASTRRTGGTGRERELAQTPAAGRTVKGRTNPKPTRRSTGTPAGAGSTRLAPGLDRERRRLRELEETLPAPPSSLEMDRMASAARTGRAEMREARREHTESSPALTGGDVDANWQNAYATGDEAPGGDNPTPDQDRVDDIGKALGVTYEDNEELKAADKIIERDRHRWELDPASSEDYRGRDKNLDEE